ncbi:MAG: hypothetical protein KTR31_06075 [Myxococcales bacterium]|nr:hypothetical protein [Myxococcales bacterium]
MFGRVLRGTTAAIALLVATSITPSPSQATTFAELTVEQFTDASTWIVEGKVTRVWTELHSERSLVWTRAEVDVSRVLKGPSTPDTIVVDSLGGKFGDLEVGVPGRAVFSEGERVFMFLDDANGRLVPISKFLGKFTIRRAAGEDRHHVMNWHPRRNETFDHRFLPHPAPEHRVYLDDMIERVSGRLQVGWDGNPIPGITAERLESINRLERRMPHTLDPETAQ